MQNSFAVQTHEDVKFIL